MVSKLREDRSLTNSFPFTIHKSSYRSTLHSLDIDIVVKLLSLRLYSHSLGLGRFFSFLILNTVGRTPSTGDQPVARPLPTRRTAQTQNKRTQTSMA
jgi:hypothetical protein